MSYCIAMKLGFWAAVALAVVGLADLPSSPVLALLHSGLFFGLAWGIRRGRPWAAMVALALVAAPVTVLLMRTGGRVPVQVAIAGLLLVLLAALFARAAAALFRRRGAGYLAGSDWVAAVFIVLVFAACFSIQPYVVPAGSMANTLLAGDCLLVELVSPAVGRNPSRNDIVVFRRPGDPKQTLIKRVVGVPGDRIRIRDKQLIRNGSPVTEPWAVHLTSYTDTYRDNFPGGAPLHVSPAAEAMLARNVRDGEVAVPEGYLFVLGDNRDRSLDSRYFGFVPKANVVGRPLLIYGSYDRSNPAKLDWKLKRL